MRRTVAVLDGAREFAGEIAYVLGMNKETRHEFSKRLEDAARTLTKVADEMENHPDATHEERVFARTVQSTVNTHFNPAFAVFRVTTQSLPPEN